MFETFESRVIIQYSITTSSDLHIGGHGSFEPSEVDMPVLKNSRGYPIIPGSSLKGVFRTEMERLLKGLKIETCTVPNVCKSKNRKVDTECPVCQIFGGGELAASVRIRDATANSKKTHIRDGVAIDREKRKSREGAKYDIEVVPKGTIFEGEVVIENPKIDEFENAKLGGFLSLIEFFNACSGSIGSAVSRGFGNVRIKIDNFRILTAKDYLEGDFDGKIFAFGENGFDDEKEKSITSWREYLKSKNS